MNRSYKNTVVAILLACILTMAIGYAALQQRLNISGTSSITSVFKVKITNIVSTPSGKATNDVAPSFTDTTANFSTNLVSPKDSMTYDITVENQGNLDAILKKITISDSGNPAITFTSSGLKQGDILKYGESTVLTVKVEYDNSITSQPENISGNLTVKLDYEQLLPGINDIVETASSKLIATAVTSGDGLYADEFEECRYVYRGASVDNYVTFNDEEAGWRIVAIECDGSIKLMKNSSIGKIEYALDNRDDGSSYCLAGSDGCNAWAASDNLVGNPGLFSSSISSGTVSQDASLNTYLNNTYYNSLTSNAQDLIVSYDFRIGPILYISDILKTIDNEKAYLWNGKIALLNPTDYVRAMGDYSLCGSLSSLDDNGRTCKTLNWMGSIFGSTFSDNYWSLNPMDDQDSTKYVVDFNGLGFYSGSPSIGNVSGPDDVVPVLYISGDGTLEGTGDINDPYVINLK